MSDKRKYFPGMPGITLVRSEPLPKLKRPHKLLLAMLQGPKVPKGFECDGCTMSPDAWFYWACRIHDYEYAELRVRFKKIRYDRENFLGRSKKTYVEAHVVWKLEMEKYADDRRLADKRLKRNIYILSRLKIDKVGNVVTKFPRFIGWIISKIYYDGVRLFGRRAAM